MPQLHQMKRVLRKVNRAKPKTPRVRKLRKRRRLLSAPKVKSVRIKKAKRKLRKLPNSQRKSWSRNAFRKKRNPSMQTSRTTQTWMQMPSR